MSRMRNSLVIVPALLLAAATAAADTVVTIDEVLACSVESASADSIRVRLTRPSRRPRSRREAYHINRMVGRSRTLLTADVYEVRFSDPGRVADMAVLLPHTRVTADSGQPVPSPEARAQAMVDRWAGTETGDSTGYAGRFDTLARYASPTRMAERCREMRAALLGCGRDGGDIVQLLRDVDSEERAVRGIWPGVVPCIIGGASGGLGCGIAGVALGLLVDASTLHGSGARVGGAEWGCAAGCAGGTFIGMAIGMRMRRARLARHRVRVNDLIRRVNRAVAEP